MKNIFIDVETTGVNPYKHGIIQLSAIATSGTITETFSSHMNTYHGDEIDDKALEVNHIKLEQLETFPSPMEARHDFLEFLGGFVDKFNKHDKLVFIGYNCMSFDYPFLRRWFEKAGDKFFGSWFWWPSVDVAVLAMANCKNRHEYPDFKLATVCKMNGLDWDEVQAHDALYDVRKTKELYEKLTGGK